MNGVSMRFTSLIRSLIIIHNGTGIEHGTRYVEDVTQQSPGLPRMRLPWVAHDEETKPQRGFTWPMVSRCGTPLGFVSRVGDSTQGGAAFRL
jgi:hypothetical protein